MNDYQLIRVLTMALRGEVAKLPFEYVVALQDDATLAAAWRGTWDLKDRVYAALALRPRERRTYTIALFERVARYVRARAAQPWVVRLRADAARWPRPYMDRLPKAVMDRPAGYLLHAIVTLPQDVRTLADHTLQLATIESAPHVHQFVTTHLRPPTAAEIAPPLAPPGSAP